MFTHDRRLASATPCRDTTTPHGLPESLLIVAGWGCYPRLLALGARQAGVHRIAVLGFKGSTDTGLRAVADTFVRIPFGNLAAFLAEARATGCAAVAMGGQIHPLSLFSTRFDDAAREEMRRMPVRNAHTLFGRLAELLSDAGMAVLPASLFMHGHIPSVGLLTRRAPNAQERSDLDTGFAIGVAVCDLDIGQTVVVKDGVVLAVEAFEGTNAAIRRGAQLGGRGAVVVKVAKREHDMRFDIPVIGLQTLNVLRRCRISTLGVHANRVILLEQPRLLAEADRMGIAIEAFDSGLSSAPVFAP